MIDFSSEVNFLKPNIQIDFNSVKAPNYDELLTLLEKKISYSKRANWTI